MKKILTDSEIKRLEAVIGEMEKSTSGELRLIIVGKSSVIGHIQELLWLSLVAISALVIWTFRHDVVWFESWWIWPGVFAVTMLAARALSGLTFFQRLLTDKTDLNQQVWTRAELEFNREIKGNTRSSTGILLFLSMMERQAVVLADQGIASQLPAEAWDDVVAIMLSGAKTGHWADRLEEAIRRCGKLLGEHFPQESNDTNELSNSILIKE